MKPASKHKLKRAWLGIFAVTVFLLLCVNQSVRVTRYAYEIRKVEQDIREEKRKKSELELARDRHLSLGSVEDFARKKLGLVDSKEDNIIVLNN